MMGLPFRRQSRAGKRRRAREEMEEQWRNNSPRPASATPNHSGVNTPAGSVSRSQSLTRGQNRRPLSQLIIESETEASSRPESPIWHSTKDGSAWKERGEHRHSR
jgi:hypothetical protein